MGYTLTSSRAVSVSLGMVLSCAGSEQMLGVTYVEFVCEGRLHDVMSDYVSQHVGHVPVKDSTPEDVTVCMNCGSVWLYFGWFVSITFDEAYHIECALQLVPRRGSEGACSYLGCRARTVGQGALGTWGHGGTVDAVRQHSAGFR